MAISIQLPFISGREQSANATAQKAASKAAQEIVMPLFLSTIWFPGASYLWTVGWLLEKMLVKRFESKIKALVSKVPALGQFDLNQIDMKKVDAFSLPMKIAIVAFDFIWFFVICLILTLSAAYICRTGLTGTLQRLAAKVVTGGQINFDFCKDLPQFPF